MVAEVWRSLRRSPVQNLLLRAGSVWNQTVFLSVWYNSVLKTSPGRDCTVSLGSLSQWLTVLIGKMFLFLFSRILCFYLEYVASYLPVVPCKGSGVVQPGEEKASEEPPGIYRWIWRRQGPGLKLVDSPITIYQWRLVWSCSHFEKSLKEDALKRRALVSASWQWCEFKEGFCPFFSSLTQGIQSALHDILPGWWQNLPATVLVLWAPTVHWQPADTSVRLFCSLISKQTKCGFGLLTLHAWKQEWLSPFLHIPEFSVQELPHVTYCLKLYKLLLEMVNT